MTTDTRPALVAANQALGERFFQEQDRLRGGPAPELCASSYTAVIGGYPPMDRAGHEGFARGFYQGFPDARHEIADVFATDDRVAVRFILHGTHTGNFFGIPGTGRTMKVAAHAMLTVADGKVTAITAVFDEATLLRQLGVLQG